MARDRAIGGGIFGASIIGILIYGALLWFDWSYVIVLRITAFVGVGLLLGILAWIGWTMATTPPPTPLEVEVSTKPATTPTPGPAPTSETSEKKS